MGEEAQAFELSCPLALSNELRVIHCLYPSEMVIECDCIWRGNLFLSSYLKTILAFPNIVRLDWDRLEFSKKARIVVLFPLGKSVKSVQCYLPLRKLYPEFFRWHMLPSDLMTSFGDRSLLPTG